MTGDGEQHPTSEPGGGPARSRSNWTASRVIGMVFASIGGLVGLALLVGGIAVLATYAITTEDIDLGVDEVDWAPDEVLGDVRVQVDGGDKPVFVGIGSDDDVDRYLGNVTRDELIEFDGDNPEFDLHEGSAPRAPPGEQDFWVAEAEGAGEQPLTWDAEFG